MGVKNLWDILDSCKKVLPLHHLQNKRVCIDLSCWIVQLQNVNKSHCPLKEKVYLKSLFHRLRALIALNCSLILVTDGSIPAIKLTTYRQRLNSGTGVGQDVNDKSKATSLKRNMGSEFSCMIKEAKLLGAALGIPCLDGVEEAEAQCALLNSESLCDGCFTSDSDVFLFGARTVYREICLGEGGYVVCYEMDDIESKLGFGRNSLISLGILLGSDYSAGVRGIGPENACRIVKSVGDRNILQKIALEGTLFLKNSKGSKKQGNIKSNVKEDDLDHEINVNGGDRNQVRNVVDAYLKPKCHSADSDVVLRVLGLYSFHRIKLQQTCAQFFDWPPEITDEYILPKIAERDLRRFANLRITSSALGVQLPLNEIPVKCPLSGIVKRRKASGQECFEVSWEEIDGLKTSIVPANLVESACPEKIAEFEAERAEKKKPKPRKRTQKKLENKAPLEEIEQNLQNLLLDIERESSHKSSSPIKEAIPKNISNVVPKAGDPRIQTSMHYSAAASTINIKSSATSAAMTEVIDLLSPTPIKRGPVVSKRQQADVKCIDIIDLSDTEIETSPEHARKARDFRLFLASIREDQSK